MTIKTLRDGKSSQGLKILLHGVQLSNYLIIHETTITKDYLSTGFGAAHDLCDNSVISYEYLEYFGTQQ